MLHLKLVSLSRAVAIYTLLAARDGVDFWGGLNQWMKYHCPLNQKLV